MGTRGERFNGNADLVLEGGGVKGVALAGALSALHDKGYRFDGRTRVGGASAGAVIAALVAAGVPVPRLAKLVTELDYRQFRDRGPFGLLGAGDRGGGGLRRGRYRGDRLRHWVADRLAECGVHTFGDLRMSDPGSALPPGRRYRLVVVVSDIAAGRPVFLPWDYPRYGLDPDRQLVADAVRASASIPFVFRPVRFRPRGGDEVAVWTDGRLLSDFPVGMFDRTDGVSPRWPTFGVKLANRPLDEPCAATGVPAAGVTGLARSMVHTMLDAHDRRYLDAPAVAARTIFVDTMGVRATQFELSGDRVRELYYRGRAAAEEFLVGWDFAEYLATRRG